MNKLTKKQGGFVEISLPWVFLIVGIMGVVAYTTVLPLMDDANADALNSGNTLMVKNIRASYRNATSFTGLNNTEGVTMEVAPANWMSGTASITNTEGGSVTLSTANISGTADGFSIAHALLDGGLCREHVNDVLPLAHIIRVGGTTVKSAGATTLNPSIVNAACNNASNTVTSIYTRQ